MAFRIEHRIGVAAPADTIWELLYDVERWPQWNPLYPAAKGQIRIGERLRLTEAFPGVAPQEIAPVVLDWEPRSQVLWQLNAPFSRSVRYIEVEALTETGCIFANGAFFHGLIGQTEAKSRRRAIYAGYEALGEAVNRLSETAWAEQAAQ